MTDFYTIETPPSSSSMRKDSSDDTILPLQSRNNLNLLSNRFENPINQSHLFKSNTIALTIDEPGSSTSDDLHAPLRRSLGNTKLKTRQDVRRFRKFLKRNHDLSSVSLTEIDPDTMRRYLIDYLTSIRTRKGLKYDPETLRSYYLSIQRYLKDANYPYCLRSSPQFAQCRDLIIQIRKEKNQEKSFSSIKTKKINVPNARNSVFDQQDHRINNLFDCSNINPSKPYCNLLPSSSLPPRKRQQMKYFSESHFSCDFLVLSSIPRLLSPSSLSSAAYFLLIEFSASRSFHENRVAHFEKLLDQSPACGKEQRLMLTNLCNQWTGDIRLIHTNLRPQVNSFLPHILLLNILSSNYS